MEPSTLTVVGWWRREYDHEGTRYHQIGCVFQDGAGRQWYNAVRLAKFSPVNGQENDVAEQTRIGQRLLTDWIRSVENRERQIPEIINTEELARAHEYLVSHPLPEEGDA